MLFLENNEDGSSKYTFELHYSISMFPYLKYVLPTVYTRPPIELILIKKKRIHYLLQDKLVNPKMFTIITNPSGQTLRMLAERKI